MSKVVEVHELVKRYAGVVAVDSISFAVEAGEIFGMVGPNGAGKTTTIECVEGLRRPDEGRVRVLGVEPRTANELRQRIGIQLQESNLPQRLKVSEAMRLFASFYRRSIAIDPLLERLGLAAKIGTYVGRLSGGQKQRLFIALALINDPQVVFLDELTTGLDPLARRDMWELVEAIRHRGKTVFLTTHFMEEAERLCDRVAILDRGRIVALDTPARLVDLHGGGTRIYLATSAPPTLDRLLALDGVQAAEHGEAGVLIRAAGGGAIQPLMATLHEAGIAVGDVRTERPSLEDVFLALTGRSLEEKEAA